MSERSSPSRVAGLVVREVTVAGQVFTLNQSDKVRKAADEESLVLSRRQIPDSLTGQDRQAAIGLMLCGIATPEEWGNYYRSLWPMAFKFWCAMDPRHQDDPSNPKRKRTLLDGVRWCYELINTASGDELENLSLALRVVSQEEEIKNSSGQTPPSDTQ
jgi:hypothetical protein